VEQWVKEKKKSVFLPQIKTGEAVWLYRALKFLVHNLAFYLSHFLGRLRSRDNFRQFGGDSS
jgi:hypothetical protein